MTRDLRIKILISLGLIFISAYILAPFEKLPFKKDGFLKEIKIRLGIDLAGGGELRYRSLPKEKNVAMDEVLRKTRAALEMRVKQKAILGEPRINVSGKDMIIIQLPGADLDTLNEYKRLFGTVGKLDLKAVASKEVHEKAAVGQPPPEGYEWIKNDEKMGGEYAYLGSDHMLLEKNPVITGAHITGASHAPTLRGAEPTWKVDFTLNLEGAKLFDEKTAALAQASPKGLITIILDGQIKSKPTVNERISDGSAFISGRFTEKAAEELAIILRSGSLPEPIGKLSDGKPVVGEPEFQSFVGPTLGEDSIRRGLWACFTALALVVIFMIGYYRLGGFIADVALLINLLLLLGIMAFFHAELTLPGIAGIVLTVGMAVDANILIFERIREEQARGKTVLQAFEAGHERAFVTILDSNLTTLLAAVILYLFGSGPIEGFAVTLSIGILTTMFSVLFSSKAFLKALISVGTIREFRMRRLMERTNYQFTRLLVPCAVLSTVLVLAGLGIFLAQGKKNFGMDFLGGSVLNFAFHEKQDIQKVRQIIEKTIDPATQRPKYGDADVQTMADPTAGFQSFKELSRSSRFYQVRSRVTDPKQFRKDIETAFEGDLSHEPFEEIPPQEIAQSAFAERHKDVSAYDRDEPGGGLYLYFTQTEAKIEDLTGKIKEAARDYLRKDDQQSPVVSIKSSPSSPKGLLKLELVISEDDWTKNGPNILAGIKNKLKDLGKRNEIPLSNDPFLSEDVISPAVAEELAWNSTLAIVISWVAIILYVAFRYFGSWKFGFAAVVALIHDAIVSIGFTAAAGALVPKDWGLNFEMNLSFVAAVLTIIGYSVNDTIVIFDRIRENLLLMKKETFAEVIDASVNQTMSRTIITSLTVWISVIVLYLFTMKSAGGVANFAFPLIIGVLVGTYSTVYIASPLVLVLFGGRKPNLTAK